MTEDAHGRAEESPDGPSEGTEDGSAGPAAAHPAATAQAPDTRENPADRGPRKPERRSRISDAIIVIVLAAIAFGGLYFREEIQSAIELQVWSKAGPRKAMEEIKTGLAADDLPTVRKYLREGTWTVTVEDGAITGVQASSAGLGRPLTIDRVAPTGSMEDTPVEYDLRLNMRAASVVVDTPSGQPARYTLRRDDAGWYVHAMGPLMPLGSGQP